MAIGKKKQLATAVWDRYRSALTRGHADYQIRAQRNEDFYLGAGLQWETDLREQLEAEGRPWIESNLIFSIVNTVTGYQTQSRLDIAYKPRESGDQDLADILSKIGMHVLDQNEYPWVESSVFSDGIIQSRGYFDIRMSFDDNYYGNISIKVLDPLDVIPDPDAKDYNPDTWDDVLQCRWMTVDQIEETYGKSAAREIKRSMPDEQDFGEGEVGAVRNKFSGRGEATSWIHDEARVPHVRVIERQYWKLQKRDFFVDLETGDQTPVPSSMSPKEAKAYAAQGDYDIVPRLSRRVRWTTATEDCVLHDDWSPYDHFTVIPYFPYFRRGVTLGLIDNLTSVQEMHNKVLSQMLHVVNTTANSGWIVEENSLTNMDTEDLDEIGATTGITLEYKAGRERPEKIKHNEIPTGLSDLTKKSMDLVSIIAGVSDVFQGQQGNESSGVAIQSRVQQNAVQLASPIDNLYRSRHLLAQRILELVQDFYTEERMFNVTMTNPETQQQEEVTIRINEYVDEIRGYLNDTTQGKYDVVISDIPDQVTFQNAQFAQAVELRKFGVEIPDDEMIRLSGLSNKNELAKRMSAQPSEEEQAMQKRAAEAEVAEKEAGTAKMLEESVAKRMSAIKDSIDAAVTLSETPEAAAAADAFAKEAGLTREEDMPGQQMSPEEQQMAIAEQQRLAMEQDEAMRQDQGSMMMSEGGL